MTNKAKVSVDIPEVPQNEPTNGVDAIPRKQDVGTGKDWEQAYKSREGRIEVVNARIKELEDAQAAKVQEELESQGKFRELHEASQSKVSELQDYKSQVDKEIEELRSFKEKQIEDSINKALDGVPEEEKKSFIEDTKGMEHSARMRILEKLSGSINKKPKNTPSLNGRAGEPTDLVDNLFDQLGKK